MMGERPRSGQPAAAGATLAGEFGAMVRRARMAAGLTQEALATRAGLSIRAVREIEHGRIRYPRPESVRQLGEALGLPRGDLAALARLADAAYWSDRIGPEPPAVVPAQLPPDAAAFVGRAAELAALDRLVATVRRHPAVAVITGTAGVGKTALAVRWGHRARRRFPDGQVYLDLRAYSPGPTLPVGDALARLLRALGVPPEQVSADPAEATACYRSLLAERRMLVVLDNVGAAEQVRPLLPGASGCAVLVTSRDALSGLVARDGAVPISLDVLNGAEAGALLRAIVGADRTDAEPAAVAELARLCGGLPLALRITAADLLIRPGRSVVDRRGLAEAGQLHVLVSRLADGRSHTPAAD